MKILVVDDVDSNRLLLADVLSSKGHTVISARSGEEAVRLYAEDTPDLVLMDVMMPGIGGIEATRIIRTMQAERWVPVIFVSALSQRDDIVLGLHAGGDDYLAKPFDVELMMAKINAMKRMVDLEERLRVSNLQLQAYRDRLQQELDLARELMDHMVANASTRLPAIEVWTQSAANLGGDMILTQQYQNNLSYLLMTDAMGHGLSATLSLVPLVHIFSDLAKKGSSVSEMVRSINASLKGLLPAGNFVAVTLVCIDHNKKTITIWNGGNPPLLLCDSDGNILHKFHSTHVAVGIVSDADFDEHVETYSYGQPATLVLYSDGLVEAESAAGKALGVEQLYASLRSGQPHQALKRAVLEHLQGLDAGDDISLATVRLS